MIDPQILEYGVATLLAVALIIFGLVMFSFLRSHRKTSNGSAMLIQAAINNQTTVMTAALRDIKEEVSCVKEETIKNRAAIYETSNAARDKFAEFITSHSVHCERVESVLKKNKSDE